MRIKVRHETSYSYGSPANSALQQLRLLPRSHDGQFVRRWRVEVDADARLDRGEDAFGNLTHMVFVDGPLERLHIVVEGEVLTSDTGGIVHGTVERMPIGFFLRESPLTAPSPAIREMARDALASEGGDKLAAMHMLNVALHRDMAFDVEATTPTTTAAEAFEKRNGVCQDFAHIMTAAARSIGLPARYVSGYFLRTDRTDQEAGHAWTEVYIDGVGWIGFDPTHGLCITEHHVRVAVGSDYNDAAPVRGAQFGGGGERLDVSLQIAQGQTIVEG